MAKKEFWNKLGFSDFDIDLLKLSISKEVRK
jgi:hypothetical protein